MALRIRDFRGDVAWNALEIAGIKISDELTSLEMFKLGRSDIKQTYFLRIRTLHGFEMDVELKTVDTIEDLLAMPSNV